MHGGPKVFSLVIPVYKNEGSITELISVLQEMDRQLKSKLEVIFVVDGSPDRCYDLLNESLPKAGFDARLILLSRNFGSFAAIRAGLSVATGPIFAVMAADLQEPPELIIKFFRVLETEPFDIVIGTREARDDPFFSRVAANTFWYLYQKFILSDVPVGGVDIFGCNQAFRTELLRLEESHSSLIGLIFWLGFRRKMIAYRRLERRHGKSVWTLRRKIKYLLDSIFSFTDLPIKVLITTGILGTATSILLALVVLIARLTEVIVVPGYTATILAIAFFGALNLLRIGLMGSYTWRTYENTKKRQAYIIFRDNAFKVKKNG